MNASHPAASDCPRPLRNSYWVVPGRLLAGEHPGAPTREATRERLQSLLDAGIELFVDLTRPEELAPYDGDLPLGIDYVRKPIRDHGTPQRPEPMQEILQCLGDALRSGRQVYLHCRAGIGRTGMVVGCWLIEQGHGSDGALAELNRMWLQCERSQYWVSVPETEEQIEFIRNWTPRATAIAARSLISEPTEDPAALSAAKGLRERFQGALLGLAVGDAISAATQYKRPGTFTPVGDMLGGGPFDLPRGGWSDDTALALCLADSLLGCNGFDARHQMACYRRWQQQGYLSATGQCLGITATTARAITVAQWRRQAFSGSHDPNRLDPEPLSRVAPTVMFFFAAGETAIEQAAEAARATCQAPAVLEACRGLARLMHAALSGRAKPIILDLAPREPAHGGNRSAPGALRAALEAFADTETYHDAVLEAANGGGNSDVVAAACGQLAGAHYGVGGIPAVWRSSLLQRDLIESYADRLLTQAMLGLAEQPHRGA